MDSAGKNSPSNYNRINRLRSQIIYRTAMNATIMLFVCAAIMVIVANSTVNFVISKELAEGMDVTDKHLKSITDKIATIYDSDLVDNVEGYEQFKMFLKKNKKLKNNA